MRRLLGMLSALVFLLPALVLAQGPRAPGPSTLAPPEIKLTKSTIERMLEALPEVTKHTAAHRSQFMGGLTGGAGGPPKMSEAEINELRGIFKKYGFTMEEFAMQISTLLATYFVLNPGAFDRQLPSEDKPEVAAILNDPNVPQEQKDRLRKQIRFTRQNKGKLVEQLSGLASESNKKLVKAMLPKIKKALEAAEAQTRQVLEKKKKAGPRRSP